MVETFYEQSVKRSSKLIDPDSVSKRQEYTDVTPVADPALLLIND
jgi:hypothetical protein